MCDNAGDCAKTAPHHLKVSDNLYAVRLKKRRNMRGKKYCRFLVLFILVFGSFYCWGSRESISPARLLHLYNFNRTTHPHWLCQFAIDHNSCHFPVTAKLEDQFFNQQRIPLYCHLMCHQLVNHHTLCSQPRTIIFSLLGPSHTASQLQTNSSCSIRPDHSSRHLQVGLVQLFWICIPAIREPFHSYHSTQGKKHHNQFISWHASDHTISSPQICHFIFPLTPSPSFDIILTSSMPPKKSICHCGHQFRKIQLQSTQLLYVLHVFYNQ